MIVFVHGVPETAKLWDRLRAELDAESTALSLPGFACELPPGMEATKDSYADWLVGRLQEIAEPVDLVGHDWGAGLTYRVATKHGALLRSWAADVANIANPDYVWHDFAKIWQRPGDGEKFWEDQLAVPAEQRAQGIELFGVPHDDAVAMQSAVDATMCSSILGLYRSAQPNPYADWGSDFGATKAPGCVLVPTEDPFDNEEKARDVAALLGARVERLEGLGHWWPVQDPAAGAEVLMRFWKSLD